MDCPTASRVEFDSHTQRIHWASVRNPTIAVTTIVEAAAIITTTATTMVIIMVIYHIIVALGLSISATELITITQLMTASITPETHTISHDIYDNSYKR